MAAIFTCGAECGIITVGVNTVAPHWHVLTGSAATGTTSPPTNSTRYYTFAGAGVSNYLSRNLSTPAIVVTRFKVRFPSALPSDLMKVVTFFGNSGDDGSLAFRSADGSLRMNMDSTANESAAAITSIVANTWYTIDIKVDYTGPNKIFSLRVNGGTEVTYSEAGSGGITVFRIGKNTSGLTSTGTVDIDDIVLSTTAGDYPYGDGYVRGFMPTADGTHGFNLNTDFKYENTTNIATSATDTFGHVDETPMTGTTDFIAASGAATTEYVEWKFTNSETGDARAVEVVLAGHSASATANKQSLRLYISTNFTAVITDLSMPSASIGYNSSQQATPPGGGTWSPTTWTNLRARWGSSWSTVDISPVPFIDALMLEAEYAVVGGGAAASLAFKRQDQKIAVFMDEAGY